MASVFDRFWRACNGGVALVRALARGSESVEGIQLIGGADFRRAVKAALMLLRDSRMPAWETLHVHVNRIIESWGPSFIIVTAHPSFVFMGKKDADERTAVLAGTLAHMACSCRLHRTYETSFPGLHVPREEYAGPAAQERCDGLYYETIEALDKLIGERAPEH